MDSNRKKISILATSDLYGKLFPWDYVAQAEDKSGSMFQLANAIREHYDPETTLLVDGGDTVQDSFAEIFIGEEIHPMMNVLNTLGYEVWTTGNHEYEYGMDVVWNTINSFRNEVLLANLYDPEGMHAGREPWWKSRACESV